MPPGLLVFGMHRSGTSLLTRILEAGGFFVGKPEELLPANNCNEEGFWERTDVVALNEWLLEVTDPTAPPAPPWSGWLQARTVLTADLSADQKLTFQARAKRILERLERQDGPWVMKDPRICLTYDCWKEALGQSVAVILHRNPLEIAASLQKRDKLPAAFSLALWEFHLRASLNATCGLPRKVLTLDKLLSEPQAVLQELFSFLNAQGIAGLKASEEIPCRELINPELLHHKKKLDDRFIFCTRDQQELIQLLEEGSLPDHPLRIPAGCSQTLAEFHEWLKLRVGMQAEAGLLSAKVRRLEESRRFNEELIRNYQALAGCYQENLEMVLGCSIASPAKRMLHRLKGALPGPSSRLEENLAVLNQKKDGLSYSRSAPVPGTPHLAVVLRVQEPCWLPSALKTYGKLGCQTLLVTSPWPELAAAFAEETARNPLPPDLNVFFIICAKFSPPELPVSIVEQLLPLRPDWILAPQANEFLSPPPGFARISDWLLEMDRLGVNRVGFQAYIFPPCLESPEHHPDRFPDTLRWYHPLRAAPRRDLAWRCAGAQLTPQTESIPEGLRREHSTDQPGILRQYPFLNLRHAMDLFGHSSVGPPPRLPSVADLYYDDGHPERMNPYPPEESIPPLFSLT